MAEYPALPLFTDAFLADTLHLTGAQIGAYMLMLMTAWRTTDCTLPDDDNFLARICRMDKRTWQSNKAILLSFWQRTSDAKLFQKRLKDERNYVEEKRNKNVAAGNASALKRKNRHSTGVATSEQQEPNQPTTLPTPTDLLDSEPKGSSSNSAKRKKSVSKISFDYETAKFSGLETYLPAWKESCPALNIETEIAAAAAWLIENPENKKSRYAAYLGRWLRRAQDRAPRVKQNGQAPPISFAEQARIKTQQAAEEVRKKYAEQALSS